MGVEVRKRNNENSDSLVRRFSRVVQQSGVLLQAKKVRYYQRKKTQRQERAAAKRKAVLTAERERAIKLGEIDEYEHPNNKGGRWRR